MPRMSMHQQLRAATQPLHDAVDAAYAAFGLDSAARYVRFLRAHARALAPAEATLTKRGDLPAWRPRWPALSGDLVALRSAVPPSLPLKLPETKGGALGLLYVLEGSRLGGAFLSRQVAAELPSAYLNERHRSGEWRAFLAELDDRAEAGGETWQRDLLAGAAAGFDLFQRAAEAERAGD